MIQAPTIPVTYTNLTITFSIDHGFPEGRDSNSFGGLPPAFPSGNIIAGEKSGR